MPKRALALAAVLLLLIFPIVWRSRPIEPSYQGKTVAVWLNEFATNLVQEPNTDRYLKRLLVNHPLPAMRAMFEMGPATIPFLRRALHEGNSQPHQLMHRLFSSGPKNAIVSPAHQTAVRKAAAICLAHFESLAQEAAPDLISYLDQNPNPLGSTAGYALLQIGPRPADLPHLVKILTGSTNLYDQLQAIMIIGKAGSADLQTIQALLAASKSKDRYFAAAAIRALGDVRAATPEVRAFLKENFSAADFVSRLQAVRAYRKAVGPDELSTKVLQQTFDELIQMPARGAPMPFPRRDGHLLEILDIFADEKPVLDALINRLQSHQGFSPINQQLMLARIIWTRTGETNGVLEVCRRGLADLEAPSRREAARLMFEICAKERLLTREVEIGLLNQDLAQRLFAAAALWKINGQTERTIPILIEGLRDHFTFNEHREIRRLSAECLGEMGPKAIAAKEPLTKLLHDPDPKVRAAARSALRKLN